MAMIFPSLIAADLLNLQKEIEQLDPYCSGYQLDVMDNHFVPNLSFGSAVVNSIARITYKTIWVHLMVDDPHNWLGKFFLPPDSIISFHLETTKEIRNMIKRTKEKNWLPSIAINPKTPINDAFPLLDDIYQVLVMSVEPGFAGQEFLKNTISKLESLISYRETSGLSFKIGIDGGINLHNIAMLAEKGVDDFAIGSAIFNEKNPIEALKLLNDRIQ